MSDSRPTAESQFGRAAEKYLTSTAHNTPEDLKLLVARTGAEGGRVLDVATGAGHTAYAFAPFVDEVVAFDITQQMLDIVAAENDKRGGNIRCVRGDVHDMPFSDGEFDGIACRTAAHHFRDVPKFVSECVRVLKPGGWLLIVDTVSPEDEAAAEMLDQIERRRDPSHHWSFRFSDWVRMLCSAGLEPEWLDANRWKTIHYDEWLDRMHVPTEEHPWLTQAIFSSSDALREYLKPVGERDAFYLQEAALLFRLPE